MHPCAGRLEGGSAGRPRGGSSGSPPSLHRVVALQERPRQLGQAGAIRWMEPRLQKGEAAVL